ncbi:MAG: glycosyltransferase [Planctomycetes bacterium]|nr:glycosyltransferase [Planctomycetota bacterium]MBL7037657.1 glycosyltransferase [Pirellulaceae bacterium]
MRVAIVDEELPYPATSGKRIRTLNLTLRLARRHRLTYICHRNTDEQEACEAEQYFRSQGIQTIVVDRIAPTGSASRPTLGFYARLAWNLASRLPYSVQTHASRALRQAITKYASSHHVDLWHCEWSPYAESLDALNANSKHKRGSRVTVVMAHNVESLIWQRYYENETNPLKRWYIRHQWKKFQRFERCVFGEATRVVTVSEEDAKLARREFGAPRVSVVENGVDVSYFKPIDMERNPNQILFLGSLDWRPNLDGITQMLDRIFPRVLSRHPSAGLVIVGRKPPAWLVDRAGESQNVRLHADVADVRPFMHCAGVMAVPLRIGGGSRLKIIEAAACGLPVVSTKVGAEGLCFAPGEHIVEVESVDDMADALIHSIGNPQQHLEMADRAYQVVVEQYDWDVLADKLDHVWMKCVGGASLQPANQAEELERLQTCAT